MKKEIKSQKLGLQMLKLNICFGLFKKKMKILQIKNALEKIKLECIKRITRRLKSIGNKSKINSFRNRILKFKIKKLIICIKGLIKNKNDVQAKFREFFLTKKIFYFLKSFYEVEKKMNDEKINKFLLQQKKRKIFNLLKNHILILRREEQILYNLKKFFFISRKRKLKSIFYDWKRYFVCEKYIKYKSFQKKIQIFYSLKYLINKNN